MAGADPARSSEGEIKRPAAGGIPRPEKNAPDTYCPLARLPESPITRFRRPAAVNANIDEKIFELFSNSQAAYGKPSAVNPVLASLTISPFRLRATAGWALLCHFSATRDSGSATGRARSRIASIKL